MTYPPQPGQPDPYGQQPPPSGGFPQQGGWDPNQQQQPYPTQQYPQQGWDPNQQQPGWDPNMQQQQQYGQPYGQPQQGWDPNAGGQMSGWNQNAGYSQGFGGPPAPPKKSKTGLIIALVAVVVVLAAVGITGFVAPGFFLSKDSTTASGPEKTTADIVDALNRKDKAALNSLKCGDAEEDISQIIDNVDKVSDVKLVGTVTKLSETEATAIVSMKINGNASTRKGTLGKSGDTWCWRQVGSASSTGGKTSSPKPSAPTTKPSSPGNAGGGAAKEVLKQFIDKLNSGDTTGAQALGCEDTRELLGRAIEISLKPPAQLVLGDVPDEKFLARAEVSGTMAGTPATGKISATNFDDKGFCVSTFLMD